MSDDLTKLAADLSAAPREAWPHIATALGVTAGRIKKDWNSALGSFSSRSFKHVGGSVDYDDVRAAGSLTVAGGSALEVQIGPNLGRTQGAFAGWLEEGQANIPALRPGEKALKANEADFERGILNAVSDGLRDAGL